jgi:hypothetical protein
MTNQPAPNIEGKTFYRQAVPPGSRIPMLEVSPTMNDEERKKKVIENKSMKVPKR